MGITITMTCTFRPHILDQCLQSIRKNIIDYNNKKIDFSFLVNIDPVGDSSSFGEIKKIFRKYGLINVSFYESQRGNFPLAVKNLWLSDFSTDYVFHIEDDILFTRCVDIDKILKMCYNDKSIGIVRLQGRIKKIKKKYGLRVDDYGFYVINSDKKFPRKLVSMTPSIFRRDIIKRLGEFIREGCSPEWTLMLKEDTGLGSFEEEKLGEYINSFKYVIMKKQSEGYWKDIGRTWRKMRQIKKPKLYGNKRGISDTWIIMEK